MFDNVTNKQTINLQNIPELVDINMMYRQFLFPNEIDINEISVYFFF